MNKGLPKETPKIMWDRDTSVKCSFALKGGCGQMRRRQHTHRKSLFISVTANKAIWCHTFFRWIYLFHRSAFHYLQRVCKWKQNMYHQSSTQEGHMSPERLCNLFPCVQQHTTGTCSACIGAISQLRPLLDHGGRLFSFSMMLICL